MPETLYIGGRAIWRSPFTGNSLAVRVVRLDGQSASVELWSFGRNRIINVNAADLSPQEINPHA